MADAPRWEDLFPQESAPPRPATPAPPAAQQQPAPQQYPPTQALPQQGFGEQGFPQQFPAAQPPAAQLPAAQPPAAQPPAYQPPPLQPPAAAPVSQPAEPTAYRAPAEGYQLPPVQPRPEPLIEPQRSQTAPAWPAPPAAQRAAEQTPVAQLGPQPPQDAPAWQQDASTRALPQQQGYPAAALQPEAEIAAPAQNQTEDPFASLFGAAPAAASTPSPAAAEADPFASLWAQPSAAAEPAQQAAEPDPFAGLFASQPATTVEEPRTRRSGRGGGRGGDGGDDGGSFGGAGPVGKPRKRRRLLWLKIGLPIVLVLAAIGGVGAFAWFNYNEQVRELLGIPLPTDYEGTGNGTEVIVTIRSGDIGSDVASTLHQAGVTMTFDAVYDYLVEHPDVGFTPGNWSLQEQMSAEAAVTALQDPANKVTSSLLIREGEVLPDVLEIISSTTGIPLEEVQAAAADPTVYGVTGAPSLEGYLFPATYELDGSETAGGILQMLVNETFARLDALGVPAERRHEILTMAGLIQREAGSNPDDFYKVSRVFWNRIDQGMLLQSDATVAYGTGNLHTVWTTDAERADPNNPYNTYVHPGLPVGPIGAPGELAVQAALQPADGPWLYFVPINLATGETVFSETAEQHEAAVDQLQEWCAASDENASYCE